MSEAGVGRDTAAEDILVAAGFDRRAVGRAADLDVLIAGDQRVRGQTEHQLRGARGNHHSIGRAVVCQTKNAAPRTPRLPMNSR
ncbi:hypothetical protein AB7M63_005119 [Bradyrhizobium japonicum]